MVSTEETDAASAGLVRAPVAVDLYHSDPEREAQPASLLEHCVRLAAGTVDIIDEGSDGDKGQVVRGDVRVL